MNPPHRLNASNGQVVATSEAYETNAAAKKGCGSVQRAATRGESRGSRLLTGASSRL
jgi:uncharacterized protein YegP (UPF0339 family)